MLALAALGLGWWRVDGPGAPARPVPTAVADIGGSFQLVDHTGRSLTDADFRGRPAAVFFGFTYCPEVCPTTLFELSKYLDQLGAAGERLQVLFVTVDPERDNPEQLALYLQSFNPRIVGLTGTPEQVSKALAAYKAYAKKVPTESGYTMDHTASVFLMGSDGRFRSMIDYHEAESSALAKLRLLLQ
ncbi:MULTISPECIES: SCO family protein [unclassified Chelatococcus]|uniref:SCO family protein n=1 Tax=unclassified Chelatococcus TaxID=2638111 RepID=UPI001BCA927B|nr:MULTISPECIES: SCO family protein [unclassified Chelatococcus]MBS7742629.1 SCO family protein [Chelatococcus sp. HY11]MBX3542253.1 SCO family protein [Chelatococcus sp.]MCO5075529.1 SCO family protein [Chelatococcus sp.]